MKRLALSLAFLVAFAASVLANFGNTGGHLTGFWQKPLSAAGPTLSFVGACAGTTSGSTSTASGCSIGTAATDRFVIVCVSTRPFSGAQTISGLTIAGVSATELVENTDATVSTSMGIYGLTVTSGTTADLVVTASSSINTTSGAGTFVVYTATGLNSTTPTATATPAVSTTPSGSISATSGGFVINCGASNSTGAITNDAGLTEDYDASQASRRRSAASKYPASGSVTLDASAGTELRLSAIAMK